MFASYLFTILIEVISILPIYLIIQLPIGFIVRHRRWPTRVISMGVVLVVIVIGEWNHNPWQHIPTLSPAMIFIFLLHALFDMIPQKEKGWF